jgi:Ca2+-transporting ATPase
VFEELLIQTGDVTPPLFCHIAPMDHPASAHWHTLSAEEAARSLGVSVPTGFSMAEVARRQAEYGPNRVSARRGTPAWLKFLHQFHQPLVYIMLVAVGVTSFLGEWVDAGVIGAIVLANAIVGFFQETTAETAIEALAKMVVTEATVRREGKKQRVPSESLVPGEVVLLQSGDRVPADMRLIEIRSLQVDESALTGESLPVAKQLDVLPEVTELVDQRNLAFAGTFITRGQAEGIVCVTGDQTETGRIAGLIAGATELTTPLTKQIARFSQRVLWGILGVAALTFFVGVTRGEKPASMFMAAVALAVGAIPEGLPAAVTIVLAIGVSRMARRQAIIRKLPAVETLGSTTVICSDKTGTLTENQMTVREVFAGGKLYTVTGSGYEPKGELLLDGTAVKPEEHAALAECLRAGLLCNDSQIVLKDGRHAVQGDPTEAALIVAAEKMGLKHTATHRESPRVDMIPFESEHMFRATLHEDEDERVIYQVGALERLLDRCTDLLGDDGPTNALDKAAVLRSADAMASHGLRVLAMVRRQVDKAHDTLDHSHVAADLTFLGLQGMIDPPRAAAVASVAHFAKAGIGVKMITGDHLITARAIATQIGLKGDEALTGSDLEKIADAELPEIAERITVFARVAPEQKMRLVKALQARGHVVAMTGDGVNDAPALKQADIGVAMGISGTDVAKGAAAMILTDDNFASIEAAVEEGRGVYDNLTKFIVWIIPTNLGESLMLLCAIMLSLPLPLLPLQLLWINLTDTVLGLSLAFEPKEGDVMNRPPRPTQQPLLPWPLIWRSGLVSSIMLAGGLGIFLWELRLENAGLAAARTAVVNVIVLVQVFYLFNCRALKHNVLSAGLFKNLWVIAGALTMLVAQVLFTHSAVLNHFFHSAPISDAAWLRVTAAAVVVFIVVEIEKWLRFRRA